MGLHVAMGIQRSVAASRMAKLDEANSALGNIYQRLEDLTSSNQALDRALKAAKSPADLAEIHGQLGRNKKDLWTRSWSTAASTEAKGRTAIDSPPGAVDQLLIDGQNPQIIYEVVGSIRKSTDGGATWNVLLVPGPTAAPGGVQRAAIDPQASGHLFAESGFYFCGFFCSNNMSPAGYRSVDGGQSWSQIAPFNANAVA